MSTPTLPARAAPAAPMPLWRLLAAGLLLSLLCACTGLKLVADHDAEAAKGITETSAEVFAFYDKLIDARAEPGSAKLAYAGYAADWGRIETRIRVMEVREAARPLNAESQRIARTILEFWQKYRAAHQKNGDYPAALAAIHRDRFQRLFTAALVAERAKGLATADADPGKD
ncbi:hypothetical protein [Roseateles puraquae]|nr:hypothetical protein [Roseateles puraquae]MDG0854902.1 hypothetical protein [Roseateles puraquae]